MVLVFFSIVDMINLVFTKGSQWFTNKQAFLKQACESTCPVKHQTRNKTSLLTPLVSATRAEWGKKFNKRPLNLRNLRKLFLQFSLLQRVMFIQLGNEQSTSSYNRFSARSTDQGETISLWQDRSFTWASFRTKDIPLIMLTLIVGDSNTKTDEITSSSPISLEHRFHFTSSLGNQS